MITPHPRQRILKAMAIAGCALGLVSLGLVSLVFGKWLPMWQPAPESWRMPGAYVSGTVLLLAGIGLGPSLLRRHAAALGALWIGAWALFLHVPRIIIHQGNLGYFLGLGETIVMALGLALIALPSLGFSGRRGIEIACGSAMLVFGASHFVYAELTADMVPDWIPQPLLVTYLTGTAHALAGALLIAGRFVRIAAAAEAAMMASFVALLHLPEAILNPSQVTLTMTAAPILLASAVLAVGATSCRRDKQRHDTVPHAAQSLA